MSSVLQAISVYFRRRMQQLKLWQQREKEWLRSRAKREKSNKRSIYFSDSVMLLEAAARNDIDEGDSLIYLSSNLTSRQHLKLVHHLLVQHFVRVARVGSTLPLTFFKGHYIITRSACVLGSRASRLRCMPIAAVITPLN